MSFGTNKTARELFRPQPSTSAPVVYAFLIIGVFLVSPESRELLLITAAIVYAVFAVNDFLTAGWLHRCDPDRSRGATCAWFCVSRGFLKAVVVATVVMVFVDNPFGWHAPIGWHVPAALLGGLAVHSVCSLVGCLGAKRHGCRVWIDSGLYRSRRRKIWPPKCAGQSNEAGAVWLPIGTACFILLFLGLDTLARVADGIELPVGLAM